MSDKQTTQLVLSIVFGIILACYTYASIEEDDDKMTMAILAGLFGGPLAGVIIGDMIQ